MTDPGGAPASPSMRSGLRPLPPIRNEQDAPFPTGTDLAAALAHLQVEAQESLQSLATQTALIQAQMNERLRVSFQRVNSTFEQQENKLEGANKSLQALQSDSLEQKRSSEQTIVTLQKAVENLQEDLAKQQQQANAAMASSREESDTVVASLREELAAAELQCQKGLDTEAIAAKLQKSEKTLKGKVAKLTEELSEISAKLEKEQRKSSNESQKVKDLNGTIRKLRGDASKNESEIQQLKKVKEELQKQLQTKETAVRLANKETSKAKEEGKAKLKLQTEQFEKCEKALQDEIARLKVKIGQLQSKLTTPKAAPAAEPAYDFDDAKMQQLIRQNRAEKKRLSEKRR